MFLTDRLAKFRMLSDEPKPFLDHLDELRSTVIKMAVTLALAMTGGFLGRSYLFAIIQHPLLAVDPTHFLHPQSLGVVDSFSISLEMAFYAGIVISFPFLLYFLAEFVLPALTEKERRCIWPAASAGLGLFLAGVGFAYFVVLPQALNFFYKDASSLGWTPTWTVREYYSFTTQFIIAFGLSFELPVIILLLVKLEILSVPMLRHFRPHAVVVVMILSAVLTPTTDMVTMLLMGVPMYFLYEACIIVAVVMQRRERRRAAELTE